MSRLVSLLAVGPLAVGLLAVGLLAVTGPASAQHFDDYPSGGGHSGGHYHVEPGHLHQHGNHYDYHPGRIIYHADPTPSYYPPRTTYVQPQSSYGRPSYGSAYGSGYGGHSYDHQSGGYATGYRGTYGGYSHVDDLAVQLEEQANLMCLEMHYNYQHNPGYRETYREAYEILTTAKYIHGLEHAGNRDRIRQAVLELDPLFHHVQEDVRHWTRHDHRPLGGGSLKIKMVAVEETLHHLMNDVGAKSEYGDDAGETAPPAGYDYRQGPIIGQ
ncbi:MAG: hypothetical protein WBC44_17200 [Planctomycetaceae bacterium]